MRAGDLTSGAPKMSPEKSAAGRLPGNKPSKQGDAGLQLGSLRKNPGGRYGPNETAGTKK